MIQHEFEELLEQFSQDELNEKSTVKGWQVYQCFCTFPL